MLSTMPATASPIPGNSPSISHMELRTVAQIRSAAAAKTNQSVKGAAPMTAMNSLRRLAEEAHLKEEQGDQRAALYKFVQVGVLLQFVQESHEYKQELQRGRHGALYQMMQDFNKGPFEAMVKSVTNLQRALLQEERTEAELNSAPDGSSEYDSGSLNRRSGNSLAERLKQLQGSGIQADLVGRRIQRPPSQNFRPQSPPVVLPSRGPTPAPRGQTPAPRGQTPAPRGQTPAPRGQTPAPRGPTPGPFAIPRRSSLSYSVPMPPASPGPNGIPSSYNRSTMSAMSPTAPGTSPRQFVPVASFGPPSPTHSNGSSPEEDDIQVPRVHREPPIRSPTDFSRTFPPIDELNEREPSMFPSVPSHAPGSKPSPNGVNGYPSNGIPWKQKAFPSLNMEPRPASTPINIKRQSGGRPTTPGYMNASPQNSYGSNYPQGSPRTNGFVSTEPTQHPQVDLPITSAITPQKLYSLLETRGLNILLLDVRSRDEFERERVNHDAIVCVEPLVLSRQGINSSMIEGAQVISPSTEQVLFKNRSRFDLIIMYDQKSTTLGSANSSMSTLFRAIFENEFHRPLKKPPMLLIGGLKAWKEAIGEDGVLKRLSPTSSTPSSSLPTNGHVIPPNATGSSASTASEEETFLYDMPTVEAKYPPADQIQPQSTGSDISTETPGSNKLARKPLPRPQLTSTLHVPNYPSAGHSPLSPHAPTLVSTPGSSIQYPSPFSASSPIGPTPPQAASVNQYPISRRRNDYVEQKPYTGAMQPGKPINYPHLSAGNVLAPPPAAATSTTTRQEPRTRLAQASSAHLSPSSVLLIPSDYPVIYWAGNEIGMSGLKNLGNTCYMNSVLQCLSATQPFARFFINGTWQKAVNMMNPLGTKGKFTEGFARLLVDMWQADSGALVPYPFRKAVCTYAPQFADSNQHDAQEFLIFLLDGLHEDLNRVLQRINVETRPEREAELEALSTLIASEQEWNLYRMRNNSIVVDYFQGQFRNRMECMTCHKTSTTYNTFMHLSLPIPDGRHSPRVSLQQCLDTFVQTEVMDKNDAWNCPNCKALRKATKVLTLCRLPPVLLIHIKRFSFKGPFTEKLETLVDFPLSNLDLTNYMPPSLPIGADKSAMGLYGKPQLLTPDDPRRQVPPYKYDLFGVTNHYGTLSSGHYTAFVSSGGGWKYCDDSRISRADKSAVVTKAAYILYYKRTH